MIDKYKTCQDCPDRNIKCRMSCAGWQYREAKKKERYERNDKRNRAEPRMFGLQEAMQNTIRRKKQGRK